MNIFIERPNHWYYFNISPFMQLAIVINGEFVANIKLGESIKIENIILKEKIPLSYLMEF